MKNILLIAFLSFLVTGLLAQRNLELLTLSGTYGFPSSFEAPYEDQEAKPAGILVNVKAPVPFSESTVWFNQITWTTFHINNDIQMPADIANPIHLHSFILQTGLFRKFGTEFSEKKFGHMYDKGITILFAPRFMTDFENAGGKNFQFGGLILYQKIFSDRLFMRFGAMYHQELGGPYLVPIVETDWIINSKWSLVGQWPITGKLKYQVNDNISAGISHFGLITSYKLGHPDYEGDYIERTSIDLSLFGRVRVAGNFHLEGRFGYAVGRTYKQYSADQTVPFRITVIKFGDDRVHKNVLFDPGVVVNLRFVYNLPL
jgi:hypothetical protein